MEKYNGSISEKDKKRLLLNQLIEQRLVLQEARKKGVSVSEKEVDAVILRTKEKFQFDAQGRPLSAEAAQEAFQNELAKEGLTEKQLAKNIRNQLLATALATQLMKDTVKAPTEEQVRKLFDTVKDRLAQPAAAASSDARQAAQQRAEEAKAKLGKGADFVDVAEQYSDDKRAAQSGGDIGYVLRGEVKDLGDVLFSLPVGGFSGVVSTKQGYQIFRIEEKRAASSIRYAAARKFLMDYLVRSAERAEYARFVDGLKKAAAIR